MCSVEQGRYGHSTSKPTWLYAHGVGVPPSMDWRIGSADGQGSWLGLSSDGLRKTKRNKIDKMARSATPPPFRDVLISIARSAVSNER